MLFYKSWSYMEQMPCVADCCYRIVGGEEVNIKKFPFMVAMIYSYPSGYLFCGGSIISNSWVVTAAHCLKSLMPPDITLVAGWTIGDKTGGQQRRVKYMKMHEGYTGEIKNSFAYDIGVMQTETDFIFSENVQSIPLPINNQDVSDLAEIYDNCIVLGRGATRSCNRKRKSEPIKHIARPLSMVKLQLVPLIICRNLLLAHGMATHFIPGLQICAMVPEGGKDACKGDSGGPMLIGTLQNYTLQGIVSWGIGCAQPETPAVYTRVDAFLDWINRTIEKGASITHILPWPWLFYFVSSYIITIFLS